MGGEALILRPRPLLTLISALMCAAGLARADDAATPLGAVSLDDLRATRERPLFSPSRRPTAAPAPVAALPVEPAPAPSDAAAPPPAPPFTRIGAIIGPDFRAAMVQDNATHAVMRLRPGEEASGWRAVEIGARSLVLRRGDQSVALELPKTGDAATPADAVAIDGAAEPAPKPAPLSPAAGSLARLRRQQR